MNTMSGVGNKPRKRGTRMILPLLLLATCAAAISQEVTSDPVGYQRVALQPAPAPSFPGGTLIGCPLSRPTVSQASVTSLSGSTVSCTAEGWTDGGFASSPHFACFRTGTNAGRSYLILASSTNQLTLDTEGDDLASRVGGGDIVGIIPAWTLGEMFGSSSVPFLTGASAATCDNVLLWGGSSFEAFFHDGSVWRTGTSAASQNNTVIYPDEGIFVIRRSTEALDINLLGSVPVTDLKTKILGTGAGVVTTRFPVDMTLAVLGLHQLPGWQKNANFTLADRVLVWSTANQWETYWHDGANWRKVGSSAVQNGHIFPAATGLYIKRQGGTGQDQTLSQTRPYSL
jgi:uncharacterized protein (TIGR02597 family)